MQTMKQKRDLRKFTGARKDPQLRAGDQVCLTYGERGVITGPGERHGTYLVQVGSGRPVAYLPSQFTRVP